MRRSSRVCSPRRRCSYRTDGRDTVSETTKSAGARSRVLVVDDDAALAEMLSIVLRNEGSSRFGVRMGTRRSRRSRRPSRTWCCST